MEDTTPPTINTRAYIIFMLALLYAALFLGLRFSPSVVGPIFGLLPPSFIIWVPPIRFVLGLAGVFYSINVFHHTAPAERNNKILALSATVIFSIEPFLDFLSVGLNLMRFVRLILFKV